MEPTQEFEIIYTIKERYYLAAHREQRVERTLICHRQGFVGDLMAIEDYYSASQEGSLRLFVKWIEAAYSDSPPKDTQIIRDEIKSKRLSASVIQIVGYTIVITIILSVILWQLWL